MNNSSIDITSLSTERRKLFELLLEDDGVQSPAQRITLRESEIDSPPLSFAQQRLWLIDQLFPGNPAYNETFALHLSGRLDATALGQSLGEIIRRHEALRTTYIVIGEGVTQKINPPAPLNLPTVDLGDLTASAQEARLNELAVEQTQIPFSLSEGPLVRARLLRLAEYRHVLLLTMHHICMDGWSMGVLYREMAVLYEAFSAGRPSPLAKLPIQYADYAVWQRQRLQGGVLERQLEYWRERLRGPLPQFNLPTDYTLPHILSGRGRCLRQILPETIATALRDFSSRQQATLYHTLLAAFQALLYRYTGDTDILVGSPVAGRTRLETESLIGFFVNTVVLRTNLSDTPCFAELVGRTRAAALAAYEHQDIPFERLVEELQPERRLSHNPIFQVMFVMQPAGETVGRMGDVDYVAEQVDGGVAKFPLSLWAQERGGAIELQVVYSSDLFEETTARRVLGHYERLLRGAMAESARRLSELEMLAENERREIVEGFNQTRAKYPTDLCLHELIEQQARRIPDAVAVEASDEQLSYAELDQRSMRLARRLRSLGVGPESLVAAMAGRSAGLVVALLGVLKAGGAYVPLDPSHPAERLSFMLEDSGAKVLLTEQALAECLPDYRGQIVLMDQEWKGVDEEDESGLENEARGENLAYVIYTSGSTGRPKGVMIRHRSLVNYTRHICQQLELEEGRGEGLRFATVSTIAADLGNTCIYPSLVSGGRLQVLSYEVATDGERFKRYMNRNPIDVLKIVPSHLSALLGSRPDGREMLPSRYLILGGEALSYELVERLRERGAGCEVINHYGPTETTVGSLMVRVKEEEGKRRRTVTAPIGRPIANTEAYILDRELMLAPVGVRGELYISGDGVARGYRGRPILTAEQFIPNPFGAEPGTRLYRTGDSARWLPDGRIEYLGRMDRQVKIRGFRVELGEIESLLRKHAAVSEAVVVVKEGAGGDKRLVAYIVANSDSGLDDSPTPSELRKWLWRQLPDYMVPSAFVTLDSLPLTPNGKLDHKALPEPGLTYSLDNLEQTAPLTQVEDAVANIWAEVLDVERIGANVTFFELGGHSLLAVQIVSRLQDAFQVDIPLHCFFEELTVTKLASSIETIRKEREAAMRESVLEMLKQFSEDELGAELSRHLSSTDER